MSVFSPKNFRAWVVAEATAGTSPAITLGLSGLDVDSIGFPSLNVTQVLDKRTSASKLFSSVDFFQDNKIRTTEVSLSGTLHNDTGHKLLLKNIMSSSANPLAIPSTFTGVSGTYGVASTNTFTLVLASPDTTDGNNIVMGGCLCTNFSITADSSSDGGVYKWSATVQTGKKPTLNNEDTPAGTAYAGSLISFPTATVKKVHNLAPVMTSFGVTIDHPAVFVGSSSTGYEAYGKADELSVTTECSVKYDSTTKGLVAAFDTQSSANSINSFVITNGTNFDINIKNAVLTDVSYNEGDTMMLNISQKAVSVSTDNLITIDVVT